MDSYSGWVKPGGSLRMMSFSLGAAIRVGMFSDFTGLGFFVAEAGIEITPLDRGPVPLLAGWRPEWGAILGLV